MLIGRMLDVVWLEKEFRDWQQIRRNLHGIQVMMQHYIITNLTKYIDVT